MPPIFSFEKREEIKTTLLENGANLIRAVGVRKMAIDEVAKLSGIGKGTFYHFFPSKEIFVMAVMQYGKERIYQELNRIVEEKGGVDKADFYQLLQKFSVASSGNLISYLTREDEEWLKNKLPDTYQLHSEKEQEIMQTISVQLMNYRPEADFRIVANLLKGMAIMAENREDLYQEQLEQSIQVMNKAICDYLFG